MSLGGLWEVSACALDVLGCPSEVFGRFITALGESRRGLLVWKLHRFRVRPEGPVDTKNSMVVFLDGTPFCGSLLKSLFQHGIFGMTLVTY